MIGQPVDVKTEAEIKEWEIDVDDMEIDAEDVEESKDVEMASP